MKQVIALICLMCATLAQGQSIKGAWSLSAGQLDQDVVLIVDANYVTAAFYDLKGKQFGYTEGGKLTIKGKELIYLKEFDSQNAESVGKSTTIPFEISGKTLYLNLPDQGRVAFDRIDEGKSPMAGNWQITERVQEANGPLVKIHQTGTRKTIKIFSDKRFQWVAIDPAVKGFYGTGGGTYTAKDGKYTENLEFFSRDNSRVGASLQFNWKLDKGRWDHSGKSSKGDPIHEIWEKVK